MRLLITKSITLVISACILQIFFLYFSAIQYREENYLFAHIDKLERLRETDSPRIIFVGGSNLAFGLDSEYLSEELQTPVINMGVHAGLGLDLYMYDILDEVNSGDTVIISTEHTHWNGGFYGAGPKLELILGAPYLYRMPLYNILAVDIYNIQTIKISYLSAYVEKILTYTFDLKVFGIGEVYSRQKFNQYGDYIGHLGKSTKIERDVRRSSMVLNRDKFFESVDSLNIYYTKLQSKGVKVFIIPPAIYENFHAINHNFIDILYLELERNTDIPILSHPRRYTFTWEEMFDTNHHLNSQGRQRRTQQVLEDLQSVFD